MTAVEEAFKLDAQRCPGLPLPRVLLVRWAKRA